jgi:hypothetical protein
MPRITSVAITALSALLLAALATPAQASSTASSAASDSATSSAGSASDSVTGSSTSSKNVVTAQGDYTVVEVAAVDNKPDMVRLALQAADTPDVTRDFALLVPRSAVEDYGVAVGQRVTAHQQSYGIELAGGPQQKTFFLVLKDELRNELRSVPVSL